MTYKNPYANRWANDIGAGDRGMERKMMQREAQYSEQQPTYKCDQEGCGGTCYHRPAVGGWWCTKCGELKRFKKRSLK